MNPARQSPPPRASSQLLGVEQILSVIESGLLRVPLFHRSFVWEPEDMVSLFESLRKGYPTGSLLLWETDLPIHNADHLGPLSVPPPPSGEPIRYILDGVQRIATLYGVLKLPSNYPKGPNKGQWKWWMYYDMNARRFGHEHDGLPTHSMPLRSLVRTRDFLYEAQKIRAQLGDEAERWIEEGRILTQQIIGRSFMTSIVHGASVEDITEIFSRYNRHARDVAPELEALEQTSLTGSMSDGRGSRSTRSRSPYRQT